MFDLLRRLLRRIVLVEGPYTGRQEWSNFNYASRSTQLRVLYVSTFVVHVFPALYNRKWYGRRLVRIVLIRVQRIAVFAIVSCLTRALYLFYFPLVGDPVHRVGGADPPAASAVACSRWCASRRLCLVFKGFFFSSLLDHSS